MVLRKTLSKKIGQVSDVCLFCAVRYAFEPRPVVSRVGYQVRSYKSSIAAQRPATATARVEDDDEDDYPPPRNQHQNDNQRSDPWAPPVRNVGRPYGAFGDTRAQEPQDRSWKQNREDNNWQGPTGKNSQGNSQGFRIRYHEIDGQRPASNNNAQKYQRGMRPHSQAQGRKFGQPEGDASTHDVFNQRQTPAQRFQPAEKYNGRSGYSMGRKDNNHHSAEPQEAGPRFRTFRPQAQPIEQESSLSPDPSQTSTQRPRGNFAAIDNSRSEKETQFLADFTASQPASHVSPVPILSDDTEANDALRRRKETREKPSRRGTIFEADAGEEESERTRTPVKQRGKTKQTAEYIHDQQLQLVEEMLYEQATTRRKKKSAKKNHQVQMEVVRPTVNLPEYISVEKLAQALKVRLDDFIEKLEEEGYEGARYDHILDYSTSTMLADLYGFDPTAAEARAVQDLVARDPAADPSILPPRPPIVTIMGHVDHGKTTILDWLRKSSVVASEHGGITQHIGAFSVMMPGSERQITFLDTPGHSAFLEMRRRGANVTDIVVLVVAADDSVKPQTIEAIKHALEAKVQIIVAINKIDKEDADIERVKADLARNEISVESYGGEYQAIPLSGKTGQGMEDLEEAILTLADVNDYRAENDGMAEGWIIESKVTAGGRVATVLVRRGTLRPGDYIVAGHTWARVRTLRDDAGSLVAEAPPGTPVQVDGWRGSDPMAGAEVLQADNEDHAKEVVDIRLERVEAVKSSSDMEAINAARSEEAEARAKVLAWEAEQDWSKRSIRFRPKDNEGWVEREDTSGPKQVHFVVKADVAGSVEALNAAVAAIGNNEIAANIVHSATGGLTESDIKILASTGETGYAISFNQPVDGAIRRLAEAAGIRILDHNIIYKVTDDVKEKLSDELPPSITQRVLGEAEVGQIFEIGTKKGKLRIAGCKITNGTISRSEKIRVSRKGEVIFTGMLNSLKNVKKDVTEMRKGTECGMGFEGWEDFQEGDQIQSFEEKKEKRKLY